MKENNCLLKSSGTDVTMYHDLVELKELIATTLTVEQIMDILGWDIYDLVDALEDEIKAQDEEFEAAIRE